ncbi:MAG: hypothetical protein IPO27_09910 [Bacteroidetes bacterium]|nr:hypothetical protein [Bacteroidota bacterium]
MTKKRISFSQWASKVPYGFMNLQSSQNRLPLDRDEALNSAVSNERDLGVFFYWAPQSRRKLLASLVADGYKGSGDYGVLAVGGYNGQTANRNDGNKDLHYVARLTYPFQIGHKLLKQVCKDTPADMLYQKINSQQEPKQHGMAIMMTRVRQHRWHYIPNL